MPHSVSPSPLFPRLSPFTSSSVGVCLCLCGAGGGERGGRGASEASYMGWGVPSGFEMEKHFFICVEIDRVFVGTLDKYQDPPSPLVLLWNGELGLWMSPPRLVPRRCFI